MASIPGERLTGTRTPKPPISTHPVFPAVVALWFAALLGLGSLILPIALVERLVGASGIASLIPAAQPPLGFTSRFAIALAASVMGGLAGAVIARRIALAHVEEPQARRLKASFKPAAPRPINAHDELGQEGLSGTIGNTASRRRALAMEEDDRPSDFLMHAPLPGQHHETQGLLEDPHENLHEDLDENLDEDLLELGEWAEDTGASEADGQNQHYQDAWLAEPPEIPSASAASHVAPDNAAQAPVRQVFNAAPAISAAEEHPDTEAEPAEPLHFSPPSLHRNGAENQVQNNQLFKPAETAPAAGDTPAGHANLQMETDQLDTGAARMMNETHMPVMTARDGEPAAEPGLVPLVQRLALSLERRREWAAEQARVKTAIAPDAPPALHHALPSDLAADLADVFGVAPSDEAAQAMAAYFGAGSSPALSPDAPSSEKSVNIADTVVKADGAEAPSPELPRTFGAGILPVYDIEDDECESDMEDLAVSFSLPLRPVHSAVPSQDNLAGATVEADLPNAEEEDEDAYSSLLAMKSPFIQRDTEFVRIEDEIQGEAAAPQPHVVFPGREPDSNGADESPASHTSAAAPRPFDRPAGKPAPADRPADRASSEQALRDALLGLQRMNGAG